MTDRSSRIEIPKGRVRRIRKASEQVSDQLRSLIIGGDLPAVRGADQVDASDAGPCGERNDADGLWSQAFARELRVCSTGLMGAYAV